MSTESPVPSRDLRRLVGVLGVIALGHGLFFSALAPLLPEFESTLGMSKAQAGVLVGSFGVGQLIAAIPMGVLALKLGVKTSALAGVLLFAAASVLFGLAAGFTVLLFARLLQGAAAAMCAASSLAWLVGAAPRERRSEMISVIAAARSLGQMIGPVFGGLAVAVGRAVVFSGLAALTAGLAVIAGRLRAPAAVERAPEGPVWRELLRAQRSRDVWLGQWLGIMPSILLSSTFLLGPLELDRLGAGATGIAVTFLLAAALGVVSRPLLGRWADRRGLLPSLRLMLLAVVPLTLALPHIGDPAILGVVIVVAVSLYGGLVGPSLAFMSEVYEREGIAQVVAFSTVTLSIAIGVIAGSMASGTIAGALGDPAAYALLAAVCVFSAGAITASGYDAGRISTANPARSGEAAG